MSNRKLDFGVLVGPREDTPLEDTACEIELLFGLKMAREQAQPREGIFAEEARGLLNTWTGR